MNNDKDWQRLLEETFPPELLAEKTLELLAATRKVSRITGKPTRSRNPEVLIDAPDYLIRKKALRTSLKYKNTYSTTGGPFQKQLLELLNDPKFIKDILSHQLPTVRGLTPCDSELDNYRLRGTI